MCGRYAIWATKGVLDKQDLKEFIQRYGITEETARFNVGPGSLAPVVRELDGERMTSPMKWGLLPSWAKDPKLGFSAFNARSETVASKPMFRSAFKSRRCLVPANGYYEWRTENDVKQPYYLSLPDRRMFAFAGLWESWQRDGTTIESFSIITTTPTDSIAWCHDRMPVILSLDAEEAWIDPEAQADELHALMQPYDGGIDIWAVNREVGNTRNEGAHLVEPLVIG
jgi:putative SOS response-associated peptidase YedK